MLWPPQLGLRRGTACPGFLILNAPTLTPALTPPEISVPVTWIFALLSTQGFSLSLHDPSPLPLVLTKTPLELSTNLKAQELEENKTTLLCSYEPHGDWEPPPGQTETGLT